jgi:ATP-dependent Clp protease adaptor protein ClpS
MKINEIERKQPEVTVINRPKIGTVSKEKEQVQPPNMAEVILHNDDFTHAEYVVEMLHEFFGKNLQQAINIMMNAHQMGNATVGIYTKDVAESKTQAAMVQAQAFEHPLQLTVEPI